MTEITYYYSAHSAFAYLGSAALTDICTRHRLTLVHRPIPLSPVVEAQGSLPFRARTQAHVDYFFGREIERWAELRDVPVMQSRPTHHDARYDIASGMILALGDRGPKVDAMAHALLEAHWRDDADLSDMVTLVRIATRLGHDASALLDAAQAPDIQAHYAANAHSALAADVFGSPTYIYRGEVFYGQDRLDLLDRAIMQPFQPTRWVNPPVDGAQAKR